MSDRIRLSKFSLTLLYTGHLTDQPAPTPLHSLTRSRRRSHGVHCGLLIGLPEAFSTKRWGEGRKQAKGENFTPITNL